MKMKTKLMLFGLLMSGCALFTHKLDQHNAIMAAQKAKGCGEQLDQLYVTYCEDSQVATAVGMADALTRQRNSLAASCNDPDSTQKLARIDTCLEEMTTRE